MWQPLSHWCVCVGLSGLDVCTVGTSDAADWMITELRESWDGVRFVLQGPGTDVSVALPVPGLHNARNAASAVVLALLVGADPLAVAAQAAMGYHAENPLHEDEVAVLYDLICMRLCMNVCIAAHQRQLAPDNEYLSISQAPAWALLAKLRAVHSRYACCVLRGAGVGRLPDQLGQGPAHSRAREPGWGGHLSCRHPPRR